MPVLLHPKIRVKPWRNEVIRLGSALEPGLAAELAAALAPLPLQPHQPEAGEGLYWRCDVQLPSSPEIQYSPCFYRARSLLDEAIPALLAQMGAGALAPVRPGVLSLRVLRRGSWIAPAPAAGVGFVLGLTGARWPASWGGRLLLGPRRAAVGFDVLWLYPASAPPALSLLRRHVEAVFLQGRLA